MHLVKMNQVTLYKFANIRSRMITKQKIALSRCNAKMFFENFKMEAPFIV